MSNELKFTKGTWNQSPHNLTLITCRDFAVAEALPNVPATELQANARLIAAAPALYEALTRMRCTCDANSRYGHYDGPHCNATIARAAIALVESEVA